MAIISGRLYFITGHWPVCEGMALGPAQADADAEHADLGVVVDAAGIVGHVQAGDAERAAGTRDRHDRIEHRGRLLAPGVVAVAVGLEAHAIHRAIDFRHAQDLLDLLAPAWHPCVRSTVSQPKLLACASRSGIMSPTITTAAPSRWHEAAQARPTGPAPAT